MAAERDELVKRVFPQLRKLCDEQGVVWGEVDLRWGITDDQSAEGKVLPVRLAEIARCRPYFIGLLGERYGWVPDAKSAARKCQSRKFGSGSGKPDSEHAVMADSGEPDGVRTDCHTTDPSCVHVMYSSLRRTP